MCIVKHISSGDTSGLYILIQRYSLKRSKFCYANLVAIMEAVWLCLEYTVLCCISTVKTFRHRSQFIVTLNHSSSNSFHNLNQSFWHFALSKCCSVCLETLWLESFRLCVDKESEIRIEERAHEQREWDNLQCVHCNISVDINGSCTLKFVN